VRTPTFVFLTATALISAPVLAEDDAPDFAKTTLTGDWNGQRTELWQRGISLEAGFKMDSLTNRGGARNGGQVSSHLDLKMRADLDKLLDWEHGVAYLNVLNNAGTGVNARNVGSIMGATNIEVPVAATRVFHAWVQKGFVDNRVSILAGIYPIDSEFFAMESAATLLNPSFGTTADLALTTTPSIFNSAAFGVRTKWQSENSETYAMAALMDGIPNDPSRPKATAIRFAKGDGAFVIGEFGWTPLESGHTFEPVDPSNVRPTPKMLAHEKYGGLSKYAIGFWRYGNHVRDQLDVDANNTPLQRRSQGAYVLAERTLFSLGGDTGRDVTAFGRYSVSAGHSTSFDAVWNLGVRVRGPIASRPDDSLAIGLTRGHLGNKWRTVQANAGTPAATSEDAVEITWRAALSPWLAIQPNYQQIRHPGGLAAARTANVVGVRAEVTF
jgi:porin